MYYYGGFMSAILNIVSECVQVNMQGSITNIIII